MIPHVVEPEKWKMVHIPFTPYFFVKSPFDGLWRIVEKELRKPGFGGDPKQIYVYRFL